MKVQKRADLHPLRMGPYFWIAGAAWTVVIGTLLGLHILETRRVYFDMARNEARTHFKKDQSLRHWVASQGGLYAPVGGNVEPNPYLNHVPERDIETPAGTPLTLVNPAYMLRLIMEQDFSRSGVYGHITSLRHFRKETAPDNWEKAALVAFEKNGIEELVEVTKINEKPYLRLMRPMYTEEGCLKCHGQQGYKVGDVRGGVSIAVPLNPYLAVQRQEIKSDFLSYGTLWLLGVLGIGFGIGSLRRREKERDDALESLKVSELNYATLVGNSLTGIYITVDGKLAFANERLAQIHGYSKEELIGMESSRLVHPEDRQSVAEMAKKRLAGEEAPKEYEVRGLRKDGEVIWIQRRNTLTQYDGKRAVLGNVIDITRRKRTEDKLAAYMSELERSNRELEEFAFVASHDLQEPLRKIQTFGDLLKSTCSPSIDEEGQDYLNRMQRGVQRMQALITALLTYSRVTTKAKPFAPVSLNDIGRDALFNLEIQIQESGANVEMGDLPTLEAEPTQMLQLFQNLIGNALKFRRQDEAPKVRVSAQTNDGVSVIHFEDNGIGFDEKHSERIFVPFERLHKRTEFEGTGIGLAICRKIVERHRGAIEVKSRPGKGSTFTVTLPLAQPGNRTSHGSSLRTRPSKP
jgi:chemotaxis family two-component system sensor kinase Cph1